MHSLYATALEHAQHTVTVYSELGLTMATAESCTGGLIGHLLTQISGSSACFAGGLVTYANELKEQILRVPRSVLTQNGAVSAPVARAMAQNARQIMGVDVAVSVTGIAGPTGGTPEKPVGTVYIGLATASGTSVDHYCWEHDREGNKLASAITALDLLVKATQQESA